MKQVVIFAKASFVCMGTHDHTGTRLQLQDRIHEHTIEQETLEGRRADKAF